MAECVRLQLQSTADKSAEGRCDEESEKMPEDSGEWKTFAFSKRLILCKINVLLFALTFLVVLVGIGF